MRIRGSPSFTLIELMAATAVLSSVLLLMVGMQDQMSRAWNNANRRTETGREARAALRLMATDLASLKTRRDTSGPVLNMVAAAVTNGPIPFYYYAPAGRRVSPPTLVIPNYLTNTAMIFGVVPRANGELNLVGYYVARRAMTNLNGIVQTNAHLFRYRRDAAATAAALTNYFGATNNITALFSSVDPMADEILAYNVSNLSILAMGQATIKSNDLNFTLPEVINQGARFHVTLHLVPEEIAQRLSASDWSSSNTLAKFSRSYEFRLRPLTRPAE
jgi:type II secretory pathway component PulJ